jgi:hypothetical protein
MVEECGGTVECYYYSNFLFRFLHYIYKKNMTIMIQIY